MVIGSGTHVVDALKAIRATGSRAQLVTLSNNASGGFVKALGDNARGTIITQVFPNERSIRLATDRRSWRWPGKNVTDVSPAMVEGYATAKVLVEGLRRAGKDPTGEKIPRRPGASCNFDLGGLGSVSPPPITPATISSDLSIIIKDGKFTDRPTAGVRARAATNTRRRHFATMRAWHPQPLLRPVHRPAPSPRRRWRRWRLSQHDCPLPLSRCCSASSRAHGAASAAVGRPGLGQDKTGRDLRVGKATFNPLTLHLAVRDVSLRTVAQRLPASARLSCAGAWSSPFNLAWTVSRLPHPPPNRARIGRTARSTGSASSTPSQVRRAAEQHGAARLLRDVAVEAGNLRLIDERADAGRDRLTLTPLTFAIEKLSTLPRDRGDYSLEATLNDQTRVRWQGRVGSNRSARVT